MVSCKRTLEYANEETEKQLNEERERKLRSTAREADMIRWDEGS